MKHFLLLSICFILPTLSEAIRDTDKNRISALTIYTTSALFFVSLFIFISSVFSFWKNRKMRQFKLSEPQTHIYYKDKEKAPKLRRKVLEAMDKGGSVYKPNKDTKGESTTKSVNTESQSSVLNIPTSKEKP